MKKSIAVLVCCVLATAAAADTPEAIVVPLKIREELKPRTIIAHNLDNPRGVHVLADGSLLVAEAGLGDLANENTSRLARLTDLDRDGRFDSAGERRVLLDKQYSINILEHVRRDEVFGMASIATGGGAVLATHAIFDGPSQLFEIAGDSVKPLGEAEGNLNSITYDPRRRIWVAASSSRDQVVRVERDGKVHVIAKVPLLASGQQPVPAYVRFDDRTGDTLVSLFSGSTEGETGGDGTEIEPRSAKLIRINPDNAAMADVVTGLTVPTDLVVDKDGRIYVLEFCDEFLDPLKTRDQMWQRASHGGFKRFSGRVLRIDRDRRDVVVIANGLDAPTNIVLRGDTLLISEGMGTPGRKIPQGANVVPLQGFISQIDLGAR
ncbi:hypothetical protein HNQ60_002358 [Povalibacter uvarum]|uniref:Uncharacterized protein n=1 Tax=Povalibacter uvarum TaxID=732238 RepID=A0A841HKA5_9GAMM|nr:hypothetical protein [Povalibacter uvarum]MBB6093477.1 hypothetical protein [Povalibacter uvarum]